MVNHMQISFDMLGLMAIVFAVLLGLVKIIDTLVVPFIKKKFNNGEHVELEKIKKINDRVDNILKATQELVKLHARTDSNGIPLWYMPRSFMDSQKQIVNLQHQTIERLAEIAVLQQQTVKLLENIQGKI